MTRTAEPMPRVMWEMELPREPGIYEAAMIATGMVGCRVRMHVRDHSRPRTQKKWDHRYGTISFVIPGDVMREGKHAVLEFIRKVRRSARRDPASKRGS